MQLVEGERLAPQPVVCITTSSAFSLHAFASNELSLISCQREYIGPVSVPSFDIDVRPSAHVSRTSFPTSSPPWATLRAARSFRLSSGWQSPSASLAEEALHSGFLPLEGRSVCCLWRPFEPALLCLSRSISRSRGMLLTTWTARDDEAPAAAKIKARDSNDELGHYRGLP